jgi:hypothetical protein
VKLPTTLKSYCKQKATTKLGIWAGMVGDVVGSFRERTREEAKFIEGVLNSIIL